MNDFCPAIWRGRRCEKPAGHDGLHSYIHGWMRDNLQSAEHGSREMAENFQQLRNKYESVLAENASLRARLERARELPKKWRDEAWESVPPGYADRDLHYKYFRCDNNAGGLVDAADDLEEALRELDNDGGGDD